MAQVERHRTLTKGRSYQGWTPCVRTECYEHVESGREVVIHRCRDYGPTALRTHMRGLGVFFYRGDSHGEGGSGTLWLSVRRRNTPLIEEVLGKLINGGLIVTDGSNCDGGRNPYSEFGRYYDDKKHGPDAVQLVRPFEDRQGRRFTCIGYAGECYGPTLIWQVHHN